MARRNGRHPSPIESPAEAPTRNLRVRGLVVVSAVVVALALVGRAWGAPPDCTMAFDTETCWAVVENTTMLEDVRWAVGTGVGVALAAITVPAVVRSFRMGM